MHQLPSTRPLQPAGVRILATFYIVLAGVLGIILPLTIVLDITDPTRPLMRSDVLTFGFLPFFVIFALLSIALGIGLWRLRSTAYTLTVVIHTCIAAYLLIFLWHQPMCLAIGVSCVGVLMYIRRPSVRAAFRALNL